MKEKILSLLVVSVMVAAAFGALSIRATGGDMNLLPISIGATPGGPLYFTQPFIVYGYLTSRVDGRPLANKPIELSVSFSGDFLDFHHVNTAYTDANGKYSFNEQAGMSCKYEAYFPGDSEERPAQACCLSVTVPQAKTTLLLSSSNMRPAAGEKYTLSFELFASTTVLAPGKYLANKPIEIWCTYTGADGNYHTQFSNTIYTDANGKCSTITSSSQTVFIEAKYLGENNYEDKAIYTPSQSDSLWIQVQPTMLTLSSTNYNPSAGQQYTLSGSLRNGTGQPLANKPIDIFYHFPGAAWRFSNTIYTDANGKYSTTASSTQKVYLQTGYKVNGVYVASSNVVTITVPKASTMLTLSGPPHSVSAGEKYTLSGLLHDGYRGFVGNPLANKPIEIWYCFSGDTHYHYSNTVYTGTDGKYSTITSSSQEIFVEARFPGDSGYTGSISDYIFIS